MLDVDDRFGREIRKSCALGSGQRGRAGGGGRPRAEGGARRSLAKDSPETQIQREDNSEEKRVEDTSGRVMWKGFRNRSS